ncbi:hypothetical protein ENUP19_0252G0083 [Entamoeba nuttalli]|uniref:Calcineurin-like phosphoesterase domain-containing protein n=1 Tax=Entamoeba nuttalli TaxID=412467 RepID=A0ABQ0DRF6_9EUKA
MVNTWLNYLRNREFIQCIITILTFLIYIVFIFISILVNLPKEAPLRVISPTEQYFTLLQISDIHINMFTDLSQVTNLKEFCDQLPLIQPDTVIVTGDICHGRKNGIGFYPEKHKGDYDLYNSTVHECLNKFSVPWFDLRGNHDVDGVYGRKNEHMLVDSYLFSHMNAMDISTLELRKDNTSALIIGCDNYLNAMISMETEGYLSEQSINKIISFLERNDTYKIVATHHPSMGIISDDKKYLGEKIEEYFGKKNPISLHICGHYHMDEMAAYHHHYFEAELVTLQYGKYRVIVLKNKVAYFGDFIIGELPIIPICPGENVQQCNQTEIFIGWKVDKVEVYGKESHQKIVLSSKDQRLWTSPILLNESISVTVSFSSNQIVKEFTFGKQYLHLKGTVINFKMRDVAIALSALSFCLFSIRIIGGLLTQKFIVMKKLTLFEHYSYASRTTLLLCLIVSIIFYFIPIIIGYNSFEISDTKILIYCGVNFAKIGVYGSHFLTHGYALHFIVIIILWTFLWTVCHSNRLNIHRAKLGIDVLWCFFIGTSVFYSFTISISIFFFSPLTYLQLVLLCIVNYIQWFNQKKILSHQQPLNESVNENGFVQMEDQVHEEMIIDTQINN